jgi:hypothetical protein
MNCISVSMMINAYRLFYSEKTERNRQVDGARRVCNDNTKRDLRKLLYIVVFRFNLPWDRECWQIRVNRVMKLKVS